MRIGNKVVTIDGLKGTIQDIKSDGQINVKCLTDKKNRRYLSHELTVVKAWPPVELADYFPDPDIDREI